jgi:cation:H+ antiporter
MIDAVLLVVGLVPLLVCADLLVRGASGLARAAGIPPLAIGLTVVAFGTSAPELAVNIVSATSGQTSLAFGNIVGSCMVNIGFVLAITAMIKPLDVQVSVITREMPILLLGVATVIVLAGDQVLNHGPFNGLSRQDGLVMLLVFGVFLYNTAYGLMTGCQTDALVEEVQGQEQEEQETGHPRRLVIDIGFTVAGLIGVAMGGELVVHGAVGIAVRMGISQTIIGLTVVSLGTTLPELVTGIAAARKGYSDIAVGNVVGSCVFNLLLIGGVVSIIRPMPLPVGGGYDLLMLGGLAAVMLPICIRGPRKVTRFEGAVLLTLYGVYTAARVITTLR